MVNVWIVALSGSREWKAVYRIWRKYRVSIHHQQSGKRERTFVER